MRRLDEACRIEAVPLEARVGNRVRAEHYGQNPAAARGRRGRDSVVAMAASLALVAMAAPSFDERPAIVAPRRRAVTSVPAAALRGQTGPPPIGRSARALAELSEQHFERSKLVVLGLVARDPEHTSAKDWEYERDLAGSLLEDTRLYRRAAQDEGSPTSRT